MSVLSPAASPNKLLSNAPKGVSPASKTPMKALMVTGLVLVSFISYYLFFGKTRPEKASAGLSVSTIKPEHEERLTHHFRDFPASGVIEPAYLTIPRAPSKDATAIKTESAPITASSETVQAMAPAVSKQVTEADLALQKEMLRVYQEKQKAFEVALNAETQVKVNQAQFMQTGTHFQAPPSGDIPLSQFSYPAPNFLPDEVDPNGQADKQAFLEKRRTTGALSSTREMPRSPFEIKTGTVIPAVMITGINSDLPGQIIAQVSQAVYDTATGNKLLIPQGAKLVGTYDSRVKLGQDRVLVAWERLVFPDASTLDLEGMAGADMAGYAGFHDKVNNHYTRIFGNAFLLSLITAGFQMSQPQTASDEFTAQQEIAAALGLQMGELGMEIARRNMQIQPTLEIRPGYRLNVMVNKDMTLPPYHS